MWIDWRRQLDTQPKLRDFANWPHIDIDDIPQIKRRHFLRNKEIVAGALKNKKLTTVAAENNVSPSFVTHVLQRCLGSDDSSEPELTKALIPYAAPKQRKRRSPIGAFGSPASNNCGLTYLFENVPNLKSQLDEAILAYVQDKPYAQNLTPKYFHKEFLRILADSEWPTDLYPYTTVSQGYESLRRYYHKQVDEARRVKRKRTRVVNPIDKTTIPFEEIEIDEQVIDQNTSICFDLFGQTETLRLSRCSLVLAIDVATGARLAWKLALTKHPTAEDILAVIKAINSPWEPLELTTPGISYTLGACTPAGLGAPFDRIAPRKFKLDNAMSHHAGIVRSFICGELAATLNLGLPGEPKTRHDVEHAFKLVSEIQHRYKSTTGSNPNDTRKESQKNSKSPPRLTLRALEEILSISLTGFNTSPQQTLGNLTPIEYIQQFSDHPYALLGMAGKPIPNPFTRTEIVSLHMGAKEKRTPYINFAYAKYSDNCLSTVPIGTKKLRIRYDSRDIRELEAYSLDGNFIGVLPIPSSWRNHPLSLDLRKRIHKASKKDKYAMPDSFAGQFRYLLDHKHLPTTALELARFAADSSGLGEVNTPNAKPSLELESVAKSTLKVSTRIKSWEEL